MYVCRAFRAEEMLIREFDELQNEHSSAWFTCTALSRWFAVALDWTLLGNSKVNADIQLYKLSAL